LANSEICKYCGWQETAHDLGHAKLENGRECLGFVSTFKHKRGCPVLDCNGNCAATIKAQELLSKGAGFGPILLVFTEHGVMYAGD
jgi:hypothetical protein